MGVQPRVIIRYVRLLLGILASIHGSITICLSALDGKDADLRGCRSNNLLWQRQVVLIGIKYNNRTVLLNVLSNVTSCCADMEAQLTGRGY